MKSPDAMTKLDAQFASLVSSLRLRNIAYRHYRIIEAIVGMTDRGDHLAGTGLSMAKGTNGPPQTLAEVHPRLAESGVVSPRGFVD